MPPPKRFFPKPVWRRPKEASREGLACLGWGVFFYKNYHGRSPRNHHEGSYFLFSNMFFLKCSPLFFREDFPIWQNHIIFQMAWNSTNTTNPLFSTLFSCVFPEVLVQWYIRFIWIVSHLVQIWMPRSPYTRRSGPGKSGGTAVPRRWWFQHLKLYKLVGCHQQPLSSGHKLPSQKGQAITLQSLPRWRLHPDISSKWRMTLGKERHKWGEVPPPSFCK